MAIAIHPTAIRPPSRRPRAALRHVVRLLAAGAVVWLGAGLATPGACPAAAAVPPSQPTPATVQHPSPPHHPRWIGVAVQGIPTVYDHLLGLNAGQGLLVVMVVNGSPAAKAGLIPGDLIIRVNHKNVDSPLQLLAAANRRVNGKAQACTLRMIRNGKRITVQVKSEPRPNLAATNLQVARLGGMPPVMEINSPRGLMPRLSAPPGIVRTDAPQAVKPPAPMTLTRRIDTFGYMHVSITYAGHNYRILPTTVLTLPAPVQQMVKMLMAQHVIALRMPPSMEQKIAILKARMAFLQHAQRQIQAELQKLMKAHSQ